MSIILNNQILSKRSNITKLVIQIINQNNLRVIQRYRISKD